ncbi:uncharacterized protein LOC143210471 [Lasioglossum baleicum]|uniref:uncharacterized protein LOC143210471 n=1 Tax=Lasioglossum baleicum TaxID=434251 RepID=UPI003FCCED65
MSSSLKITIKLYPLCPTINLLILFINLLNIFTSLGPQMRTKIETCLDSCALHPLSQDASNFNPLSPGHFVVGPALKAYCHKPMLLMFARAKLLDYSYCDKGSSFVGNDGNRIRSMDGNSANN